MMALAGTLGAATIAGLFGVLIEMMRRQVKAQAEQTRVVEAVKDQVANSHDTNLRDDLDIVINGLGVLLSGQEAHDAALAVHGEELRFLRQEIAQERTERLSADQDIRVSIRTNV